MTDPYFEATRFIHSYIGAYVVLNDKVLIVVVLFLMATDQLKLN